MSSIDPLDSENEELENSEIGSLQLPKNKVQAMFQELEIMAMQKGSRSALD
jgi:hypothetical protein